MNAPASKAPRKKLPQRMAVIYADHCTGCESCIEVCPVDCIELRTMQWGIKGSQSWCEIDWDRCIGCQWCLHRPQRKGDVYELLVCPWEAIAMVAPEDLPQAAAQIGGPPEYVQQHRDRLIRAAEHWAAMADKNN